MAKRRFLDYSIYLTDAKQVYDLQNADATAEGKDARAKLMAPLTAAGIYNAPIHDPEGRLTVTPKISGPFVPPCITSEWFYSDKNFPLDQTGFKRKSGGWFGIPFLFGTTTYYYWRRTFVYAGNGTAGDGIGTGQVNTPLATRRWVDGFELPATGEGGTLPQVMAYSRDAARHLGGYGLAFREDSSDANKRHDLPASTTESWERFYVRLRKAPTAASCIWKTKSTPSPLAGMMLSVEAGGGITVASVNATHVVTTHATSSKVLALNTWARIDVLLRYRGSGGANSSRFELYINGVQQITLAAPPGLEDPSSEHSASGLGRIDNTGSVNGLEIDFDDWLNATLPTATTDPTDGLPLVDVFTGGGQKLGLDWLNGSRMQLVRPTGLVAAGSWSGGATAWIAKLQNPAEGNDFGTPTVSSSTTALDLLVLSTDAATSVDHQPRQKGCAAFVVAYYNKVIGTTNGRLGYKRAGVAAALTAVDNPNSNFGYNSVLFAGPGGTTPPALSGLEIHIEHPNSAESQAVLNAFVVAEVLGIWGAEDPRPKDASGNEPAIVPHTGIHNAPYPMSPWAKKGQPPFAPVAIIGGTYVGTGVPRELSFNYPIHWLFIRRIGGAEQLTWWISSMLGPHQKLREHPQAQLTPHQLLDPSYVATAEDVREVKAIVRLTDDFQTNATGITYQYIAVADPAMRFLINGAFAHTTGVVGPIDNALVDTKFTAEAGFFWEEIIGSSFTVRAWFKGIGFTTSAASKLDATAEALSAADFAPGTLRSRTNLHLADAATAFSLWRRNDGSGDAGAVKVVQLFSYAGDGTASRVIALSPASGQRPLFALVVPHNATAAILRDPSHVGTASSLADGTANAATGITAGGIDAITVGLALNAAGVVYDVFVLPGDTAGTADGWSVNGEFVPVEPDWIPGSQWETPLDEFADFEGANPSTGTDTAATAPADLSGDLAATCTVFTHKVVNIALSRIGITKPIVTIGTELSAEAELARLHYTEDVEATLRDFPWAFATAYDTLALVHGPATDIDTVQAWASTVAYIKGDVVTRSGVVYECILAHTNQGPPNATYWKTTLSTDNTPNDDWTYAYRAPVNNVFARRIVRDGYQRRHDPDPPPFRMGRDATDDVVYSNHPNAVLEYTTRPICAAGSGDVLFRDALAWRLAHSFAQGLAKDEQLQTRTWQRYLDALERAKVPNANEQQRQRPNEGNDYVDARG